MGVTLTAGCMTNLEDGLSTGGVRKVGPKTSRLGQVVGMKSGLALVPFVTSRWLVLFHLGAGLSH